MDNAILLVVIILVGFHLNKIELQAIIGIIFYFVFFLFRKNVAQNKTLQRELEWMRSNNKNATKARISKIEELKEEIDLIERAKTSGKLLIPPGPRLGKKVIEVTKLTKKVGNRLLFDKASFFIPAGALVGVVGPNGIGKTTFFNLITGETAPDSGDISIGESVKIGYVQQSRQSLNPNKTIFQVFINFLILLIIGNIARSRICSYWRTKNANKSLYCPI